MNNEPKSTKPRLSWRKEKQRYGPETRRLSRGGEDWLAIVQKNKDGSWFWHGGGQNTYSTPTHRAPSRPDVCPYWQISP